MLRLLILISFLISFSSFSQKEETALPYHQIPDYPENFTAGNVNARYIDGLGYRFYWASKDLTDNDLSYRPSPESRNVIETLQHIYDLSVMIINATTQKANEPSRSDFSYQELRAKTLYNFKQAREHLIGLSSEEVAALAMIFGSGEGQREVPFWHVMNGPVADAIYHTGQLVTLRRSAGNPMDARVNVFSGKTGE